MLAYAVHHTQAAGSNQELLKVQMGSIDNRMGELKSGLSKWGRQAGKKPAHSSDEQETKVAHQRASHSFAQLEVRLSYQDTVKACMCTSIPLAAALCLQGVAVPDTASRQLQCFC